MDIKEIAIKIILAEIQGYSSNPNGMTAEECTDDMRKEFIAGAFKKARMIVHFSKYGNWADFRI